MESRLLLEFEDLITKLAKLEVFLGSEKYKELQSKEQELMVKQYECMQSYRDILGQRIVIIMEKNKEECLCQK